MAGASSRPMTRVAAPAAFEYYEQRFGLPRAGTTGKRPLMYDERYNISFFGIERFHAFDSKKYGGVVGQLLERGVVAKSEYVQPAECSEEDLLVVHTPQYLASLKQSETVARITEMLVLAYLPNSLLQQRVLRPMRLMVSGTIVSAFLAYALKAAHPEPTFRAFSINMGGGMHHAHSDNGGGWCVYSDIVLAVRHLRTAMDEPRLRVMVVDLDVHQGNGIARDKLKFEDSNLFIVDVYNRFVYPQDTKAYAGIDVNEPIGMHEKDASYLATVRRALSRAFAAFPPDLLIYNAGTDVLVGDPLGMTDVTPAAVVERDEIVFREAFDRNVPISMLFSGGYTKPLSARVIADSISNLYAKFELGNVTLDGVL